MVFWCSWYNHK